MINSVNYNTHIYNLLEEEYKHGGRKTLISAYIPSKKHSKVAFKKRVISYIREEIRNTSGLSEDIEYQHKVIEDISKKYDQLEDIMEGVSCFVSGTKATVIPLTKSPE